MMRMTKCKCGCIVIECQPKPILVFNCEDQEYCFHYMQKGVVLEESLSDAETEHVVYTIRNLVENGHRWKKAIRVGRQWLKAMLKEEKSVLEDLIEKAKSPIS